MVCDMSGDVHSLPWYSIIVCIRVCVSPGEYGTFPPSLFPSPTVSLFFKFPYTATKSGGGWQAVCLSLP